MTAKPAESGWKRTAEEVTGWTSKKLHHLKQWMTGKSEPCVRVTITSYTSVTLSLTDHECPLTSMEYMHSTRNCTSGSIGGHPTMSEVSLTYKLWIRGKCTCVCVHTCTHCHAPVMDFIFIGYDIVQGPVGLLGTRCFCVPHFFN